MRGARGIVPPVRWREGACGGCHRPLCDILGPHRGHMLFSGTSILLDAWLPLELGLVLGAETPRPKEVRPERKPMNFSRQIYWVEPHEFVIWLDQKWLHVGNSLELHLIPSCGSTMLCLVSQSCLTLCDPMDCSPPDSSVHGDSPGKTTGMGCHALLQRIFPIQESNPGLPHFRQILHHLSPIRAASH